jgi:predicted RNA-binding protein with PUA-like domain
MARRYWLMKTDPETFSIEDFKNSPGRATVWDGVRNYQARNLLRDEVRVGDGVLFYHSQADPPAVVGTAQVSGAARPDPTQFDPRSAGHDPQADPGAPRWYAVEIRLVEELERPVSLPAIRDTPGLEQMVLLRRSRLSVQPVTEQEWSIVLALSRASGVKRPPARTRRTS